MPEHPIRTLIAGDDPAAAATHGEYVRATAGFTVSGTARTGAEVLEQVAGEHPDLLLLDLDLPDLDGLEVCRMLRARNSTVDIIVTTSARDLDVVRTAVSFGVLHYLLTPFGLKTFQSHLRRYAAFHRRTARTAGPVTQHDVDVALALLRPDVSTHPAPARASATRTVDTVADHLRTARNPLSADEVAQALGISRVTARRYLEELTDRSLADRAQRYGTSGRPQNLYRWNL